MATLPQIRKRILTKFQSLPTQEEKLEFLYQVQERLRTVHNTKGQEFTGGQITEAQWQQFSSQWKLVSEKVAEQIANLREKVFLEDHSIAQPTNAEDPLNDVWKQKKLDLINSTTFSSDIDTIWQ